MDDAISTAYQMLLEACPTARLGGRFHQLDLGADMRRSGLDGAGLVARLVERFGDDVVRRAGVIVGGGSQDESGWQIHPALTAPRKLLIGLRTRADETPYDIVTAYGCLGDQRPSVLSLWRDYRFRDAVAAVEMMMVTCSVCDFALLRALGLPVVYGNGLRSIHGQNLDELCDLLGWDRAGRESKPFRSWQDASDPVSAGGQRDVDATRSDEQGAAAPVGDNADHDEQHGEGDGDWEVDDDGVAARVASEAQYEAELEVEEKRWQASHHEFYVTRIVVLDSGIVTNCDLKGVPGRIVAHLQRLQDGLDITMSEVCLWTPDLENQRIESALAFGTADDVRESILASIDGAPVTIATSPPQSPSSAAARPSASASAESVLEELIASAAVATSPLQKERFLRRRDVLQQLWSLPPVAQSNPDELTARRILNAELREMEAAACPWPPTIRR